MPQPLPEQCQNLPGILGDGVAGPAGLRQFEGVLSVGRASSDRPPASPPFAGLAAANPSHYDARVSGAQDATAWPDAEVVVQTEWNGWRTATVPVAALETLHWFQPPGACRPLVHARVRCTEILSGNLEHPCDRATSPHALLVCVLKSHTLPSIFSRLARAADERSATLQSGLVSGAPSSPSDAPRDSKSFGLGTR
jgi:hypothetical protein